VCEPSRQQLFSESVAGDLDGHPFSPQRSPPLIGSYSWGSSQASPKRQATRAIHRRATSQFFPSFTLFQPVSEADPAHHRPQRRHRGPTPMRKRALPAEAREQAQLTKPPKSAAGYGRSGGLSCEKK